MMKSFFYVMAGTVVICLLIKAIPEPHSVVTVSSSQLDEDVTPDQVMITKTNRFNAAPKSVNALVSRPTSAEVTQTNSSAPADALKDLSLELPLLTQS